MTTKPRVLLTGAAGSVGTALWQGWENEDRFDLTLTDINPIEGARSRCEIGPLDDLGLVQKICVDQDVLVHLAYRPPAPSPGSRAPRCVFVTPKISGGRRRGSVLSLV